VLFVGDDWAEDHHDVEIVDADGRRLGKKRFPEGVAGLAGLHALIADHLPEDADPADVVIGIETDRGPWVQALIAAGYTVYAVNPLQASKYRERHGTSGSKSDPGDAHVLAELVRLDRAHHRPVAGDSDTAEHVKVLARTHQSMIWSRQRQSNMLRSMLREFYPAALLAFGEDLTSRDSLAILAIAPSPEQGRRLTTTRVVGVLRKAGRKRNHQVIAEQIVAALRTEQLAARAAVVEAYAASAAALVAVLATLNQQVELLAEQVAEGFGRHPDVEIYLSQPGLGEILGARVLAEFGDDPERYVDARARKNYSGMAPVTRTSGKAGWCWLGIPGTNAWPTRSTSRRSVRSATHPAPAPSTTPTGPGTTPTTKPSGRWATGSSASSTGVFGTIRNTTKPSPGPTTTRRPLDHAPQHFWAFPR